nr:magnetosome protein Mad6 [Desulfobacteraceae bacterium]
MRIKSTRKTPFLTIKIAAMIRKIRHMIQMGCSALANSSISALPYGSVNIHLSKGICVPFLNCYSCPTAVFSCPIGSLQHFMTLQAIPYYLIAFISIIGLLIGRMACGWACPFGFIQDLMFKIKSKKYKIPYYLKYVKYAVLLFLVLIIPYMTGVTWFSKLCPAGKLTAGLPWAIWNPVTPEGHVLLPDGPGPIFYASMGILLGFLIWFVLSKRPFCRVCCPMGAILSFFNRFSMIQLEVSPKCDGCNTCKTNCPMDLAVPIEANSGECIRCLECTTCDHVQIRSEWGPLSTGIAEKEYLWMKK